MADLYEVHTFQHPSWGNANGTPCANRDKLLDRSFSHHESAHYAGGLREFLSLQSKCPVCGIEMHRCRVTVHNYPDSEVNECPT